MANNEWLCRTYLGDVNGDKLIIVLIKYLSFMILAFLCVMHASTIYQAVWDF